MSHFDEVKEMPADPIFGLSAEFKADPRKDKFTLVTGYYRGEDLVTPVLNTVSEVEMKLAGERIKREYLPIDGDRSFVDELGRHVFGELYDPKRTAGAQTVGGTGALFLAGQLAKHWTDVIGISDPTWINHWKIFTTSGLKTEPYPYYANKQLQFEAMLKKLMELPRKACVLLHTNCHNTSGMDLSKEEWHQVSEVVKKKDLFPIFDMAYQGFSGTCEEDAFAPRMFLEKGHELALTYTCAKNFSLYSERVGALFLIGETSARVKAVQSQLRSLIRGNYSNPPFHGMQIVKTILSNPEWKSRWLEELSGMRERMVSVRRSFEEALCKKAPEKDWSWIGEGKGLFCYTELEPNAIEWLRKEKGFYVAVDGRLNLTGLNEGNLSSFVEAFLESVSQ